MIKFLFFTLGRKRDILRHVSVGYIRCYFGYFFVLMISPAINQNRFIKMTMNHEIFGTTGRSAIIKLGKQLPLV